METWCLTVDGLDFACNEEEERRMLEREFTKYEVIQMLKEIWRVIKLLV